MKRKKILGACMCSLSLLLAGCQNSAQTGEELVTPREQEREQSQAGEEQDGALPKEREQTEAVSGGIAQQVQAPERYAWEGGDEIVSVKVDAPVVIPEGEGFKNWRVTSRVFTQEDYDRVSQTLLGGEKLWNRDEKLMGASNGFTAGEIDAKIADLKERKESYEAQGYQGEIIDEAGAKGRTFDEEIAQWEKLRESAPSEISAVEVPAVVSYTETNEYLEENSLFGMATVEGKDFNVFLDNNLLPDWRWINFEIRSDEADSNFTDMVDEETAAAASLPTAEIEKMAGEAMAAMGFNDFAVAGGEYMGALSASEEHPEREFEVTQIGYGVHFTRLLDGVPVTYTGEDGTSLEEGVDTSWPYEKITLIYTADGFAGFTWTDPYEVEKESDEYLFLLPFQEIQGIFEEMMVRKYSDFFGDVEEVPTVEFVIDQVRLGYMRIVEKGTWTEGKMVPVWDFMGSETIRYPDADESYVLDGPCESWLTINALDGTVIDRGFGY